jgi:hypothetical protein
MAANHASGACQVLNACCTLVAISHSGGNIKVAAAPVPLALTPPCRWPTAVTQLQIRMLPAHWSTELASRRQRQRHLQKRVKDRDQRRVPLHGTLRRVLVRENGSPEINGVCVRGQSESMSQWESMSNTYQLAQRPWPPRSTCAGARAARAVLDEVWCRRHQQARPY